MGVKIPRVLLITGNPMSQSFLTARLRRWPCEIHSCSSSREADAYVTNQQFDLVLSEFSGGDASSLSLAASLAGSTTTLVYSYPAIQWNPVAGGCQPSSMADRAGALWQCATANSSASSTRFSKR